MATVNAIMNAIFEALLRPLAGLSPWYGMAVVSAITGVVMLVIYRYVSNQRAIRRAKDRIRAHLLEVRLYRDDMGVLLRAQRDIFWNNLIYLGHSLRPLVVMIVPVVLILVQLNEQYGYRPPAPGQSVILAVKCRPGADLQTAALTVPNGLVIETPALHIAATHEIDWRIGARRNGRYHVRVAVGKEVEEKEIVVSPRPARASAQRVSAGWWDALSNPGEPALRAGSAITSIAVAYAGASLRLLRWDLHWLVAFFILSMAFGFALKGLLKVEI